jgi:hypothetical protein
MSTTMTKGERDELARLCRRREKLAKAAATVRAAELRTDFEKQMAAVYSFDRDPVWQAAQEIAQAATSEANKQIAERCRVLGIPDEFAPSLSTYWRSRGQNAVGERRAELRKVAYSRIDQREKDAKFQIEQSSLEVQTKLVAGDLQSAEANAFLDSMPTPEMLMRSQWPRSRLPRSQGGLTNDD